MNRLTSLVPSTGELTVDWGLIMESELSSYFHLMSKTPQNPEWHGEGDAWSHTKLVCECLIKSEAWQGIERRKQEELFIAALLHDIGKITCTREENGVPASPNHTSVGDRMARTILWKDLGLSGTFELQQFRETICSLIKHHSLPFHFYDEKAPEHTVIRIAAQGILVPDFSNELLSILVEADIKGRISNDIDRRLEHLWFFKEAAKESNCLTHPITFPSPYSRYAYLTGRNISPGQELYNDTWGTVILLAGLPGTGKDTYIKNVYPELPIVSLDALRQKMKIPATGAQNKIVIAAREQAKVYLRKKQPFVWNATNITPMIREKQIRIFMDYKAAVKVVFLETPWDEMLRRNQCKKEAVPESAIENMLEKLIPPNLSEAHEVEWILI